MAEYQAEFKQEGNVIVVTFPDVGYGATQGATEAEALEMAEDFLVMAIGDLIKQGKDMPKATARRGREIPPDQVAGAGQRQDGVAPGDQGLGGAQGGVGAPVEDIKGERRPPFQFASQHPAGTSGSCVCRSRPQALDWCGESGITA
jgi:predicted RNase H-like HicB family nuclease